MSLLRVGLATGLLLLAGVSHAHRAWILPSGSQLSGETAWVSVDAAISNGLFYFEHHALGIDDLTVTSPSGRQLTPEQSAQGQLRTSFDLLLQEQGTYVLEKHRQGVFARYSYEGKTHRWRGSLARLNELPADATEIELMQTDSRIQTFITLGAPTFTHLTPQAQGLSLVPKTHPNDLVVGEAAHFSVYFNGERLPNAAVTVVAGGQRYQDQVVQVETQTNQTGEFSVTWPQAGWYWLEIEHQIPSPWLKEAQLRASYSATLEVLP